MHYSFEKNAWNQEDFLPAASVRVPYRLQFGQKADCIHNEGADKAGDAYAYVSMVLKKPVPKPCRISCECRFVKYGAPLLIFADQLKALPEGKLEYGHHIEVVGWEEGINVWDLTPDPSAKDGQRTVKLGAFKFPVEGNQRFTLFTEIEKDQFQVGLRIGDRKAVFPCPGQLAEQIYVGITACEGENYFYSFDVE